MQRTHEVAMELAWLEDFLEIVATRNFSTAAAARNISQPAFSRRIRSLENWVGADLLDRSTYPVHLTSACIDCAPIAAMSPALARNS
jgi:DNA-binding transcriptional LysR family regulator